MISSVIPRIFNKRSFEGTPYQRMKLIHSGKFKNGVAVKLDDDKFEKMYKKYTNYDLLEVNYNRDWIDFEEKEEEKEYDAATVCDGSGPLKKCVFSTKLINFLKANKESTKLINKTHSESLSICYHHLIEIHGIFKNEESMNKVRQHFIKEIGSECIHKHCPMMDDHINTKRENLNKKEAECKDINIDDLSKEIERINDEKLNYHKNEIIDYFKNNQDKFQSIKRKEFIKGICDHCNDKKLTKSLGKLWKWMKPQNNNKEMNEPKDANFAEIVAKRTFNSIHCYLLHTKQELYRTRNTLINSNMRFSTKVIEHKDEEKEVVHQIDFGLNVLRWLKYKEVATFNDFKDEIINNPSSTIDVQRYKEYEVECKILCKIASIDINLKEMMSFLLYTNTTSYQSALRRAFWTKSSKQEKLNFYRWAITLYGAFKRYSEPILCFDAKSSSPTLVYHGLDNVFAVESSLPYYYGIISTTTSINTANKFSNNTGLLWYIMASYSLRFRMMTGINTEWFSAYKNEAEFICFNSYIPINKTLNYAKTDHDKINILMEQLRIFKKPIIKKRQFYKKIGFRCNELWNDEILKHPALSKQTEIDDYRVVHRLVHELGQLHNTGIGRVLLGNKFDIIRYNKSENKGFAKIKLNDDDAKYFRDCKYFRDGDDGQDFKYDEELFITEQTEPFKVFVANKKLFGFEAALFLFECIPSEINWKEFEEQNQIKITSTVIHKELEVSEWSEDTQKGGCLQLHCKDTLIIKKDGSINADYKGYSDGFGIGKGQKIDGFLGGAGYGTKGKGKGGGKVYGRKELNTLYLGSPSPHGWSSGGGIIEVISNEIINEGTISANGWLGGSGGSIKIKCKIFTNKGSIQAKGGKGDKYIGGDGRIAIYCEEFLNEGSVEPPPFINKTPYSLNEFTKIYQEEKEEEKEDKTSKNKGNDLKEWMVSNNIYDEPLYSALIRNNIDSSQKLKAMNKAQIEGIIREFRMEQFAKIEDEEKKNKIDETLVKFEKAWNKTQTK